MKRNEKKPLGCGICPYKTNSACHLERHLRIHTGQKPYACDMCSYRATDGGLLKRHMRIHSGEKPFICHICGHKTAQSCSLKDHMAVHTGKKRYSCDLCSFQCSRIGRLRDHQRIHKFKTESAQESVPRNETPVPPSKEPSEPKNDVNHVLHKCCHCNLEFSETQYLDRHVASVHGSVLINPAPLVLNPPVNEAQKFPFSCSLCTDPQESSKALNNHIACHILYKCLKCKSIFETPDELTAHGFTHTSELIFDCNFCDFKCRTRNELRGHGRIHSTQQFKCSTCDFESKSAVEFSQHLMTHTMKEIVMCNICSQKFRKTEELREHMVSHYSRVRARTVRKISELKPNNLKQEVTGDSYSCFYCSFKCPEEREVEKHILHTHVSRNLSAKHYASNTKLTRISYHEEDKEGANNSANSNPFLQPEGLHGSTLENISNSCLVAADHQQMDFSLAGLSKTVLSQKIYQSSYFIGNQYSRGYRGCQQRSLLEVPSLSNLSGRGHYTGRQSLAYSMHQFCDVQLNSDSSDEFLPLNCNPPLPIMQSNQMFERFPVVDYSTHITHDSSLRTSFPGDNYDGEVEPEHSASLGMSTTKSDGTISNRNDYDSSIGILQQRGTAEMDCEHFPAEGEFPQDNQNRDVCHSPISGRIGSKKTVTVGKTRTTIGELGDNLPDFETNSPENYQSKSVSKHMNLSVNLLTAESGTAIIDSSQTTKVPCTTSKSAQKAATVTENEEEPFDETCGFSGSRQQTKSARVKRKKIESNIHTSYANTERRVTRNSRLRGKNNYTHSAGINIENSTASGEKESSGDILLSKLRKFFNESLPKCSKAYTDENSSPQANDGTVPSSAIFTIDLSSDNETSDIN